MYYLKNEKNKKILGLRQQMEVEKEKQARAQAEAESTAKSSFLAYMSHEIRTSIAGIIGILDLTNEKSLPEGEATNYLKIAKQSGEELVNLTNKILDMLTHMDTVK